MRGHWKIQIDAWEDDKDVKPSESMLETIAELIKDSNTEGYF